MLASALFPAPLLAALLAVCGVVAGPFLSLFAARRTVRQPLALVLEDETRLLVGALADVRRLPYLASLSSSDFAVGAYGRIWAALVGCSPECANVPEDASEEDCEVRGQALVARYEEFLADVRAALLAGPAPVGDSGRLEELIARGAADPLDDAQVVEAGSAVLFAGTDRNRLSGAGLVLPTATPDSAEPEQPPLRRVYVAPSRLRQSLTAAVTGLVAAVVPGLVASSGFAGVPSVLAAGSVLSLLVLSVVISLVDIDTFYIDLRVFAATAAASWLLAVAATGLDGSWHRLLHGVGIVAGIAVVFEGGNKLHRLVRGVDGQGFGDTLIVLATAGVPPALAGSWTLGYDAVMVGMVAGALGWLVGFAAGKLTRTTPFAFGPYLAAGWVIAWVGVVALA